MKARVIFFLGAPAFSVFCAVFFTGGWLRYDHEVKRWLQVQLDSGLDSSEEGELVEARYSRDTLLLLLKMVPASILAVWFVVTWVVFGRDAFRLETVKSHFSALK